jgi:hypothetical protein
MYIFDLGDAIPDRFQAEAYLLEAAERNPGPWVAHSRCVAEAAQRIAKLFPGMDPERAYILGLLHDIGRREGVYGMRHVLDGYEYLVGEGYPRAGRACMTHSYPIPGLAASAEGAAWDREPAGYAFVQDYVRAIEVDDYDRLIQLCDALALPDGFCLMEKRLMDVALRYGVNEQTVPRWRAFFSIKQRIEAAIGSSVYDCLPGVIENTFRKDA